MTRSRATADTQDNTGGAVAPFVAGKNKVINGDFGIWQRGTSFNLSASTIFTSDRWTSYGLSGDSVSQQTFTPGTAPVAGYEGTYFSRFTTGATAGTRFFWQKIEDVRTFAGQTVTFSFWAKVTSGTATLISTIGNQNFGTGGSAFVGGTAQSNTITTSWQRFTQTATVASVSGKTIGPGSNLEAAFTLSDISKSIDIWGVQLEAGSVATPFTTASGSIGGELALCQRYYYRASGSSNSDNYGSLSGFGLATGTTSTTFAYQLPITMRTGVTSIDYANLSLYGGGSSGAGFLSVSNATLQRSTPNFAELGLTNSGSATTGAVYRIQNNNASGSYLGFSAEL